jgi:hypothetical protein
MVSKTQCDRFFVSVLEWEKLIAQIGLSKKLFTTKLLKNKYHLGMINISLKNLELNLANLNQIPK